MTEEFLKPFDGDCLNRVEFAKGLAGFIARLDSGVIAIDGEWGAGKSWFGENLKRMIDEAQSASTVWIDAFEADWDDDPSLSLIACIASQTVGTEKFRWLQEAGACLARLLPAGAKAGITAAGNFFGIDKDVLGGLADDVKDGSAAYIQRRLQDLADKKKTLEHLKLLLAKAVEETPAKKVVVFVDELDRCSPAYAIRFLERIKHLFDLKHVVYLLFWNRRQIQQAVEAFYGAGTDGQMYLDKFVDFPLHLPRSHVRGSDGPMRGILESLVKKFDAQESNALYENLNWLTSISTMLALTARETERLARWWVMSPNRNVVVLETWLLGVKVKYPDLFGRIRSEQLEAHAEAKRLLMAVPYNENISHVVAAISDVHDRYHRGDFDNMDEVAADLLGRGYVPPQDVLPAAIRRLETFK